MDLPKIVNYFSFEVLKKKIWANFQRIIEIFTKNIVKKLLKIWSWDPGSGKNLFRIPDPGSRGQEAPDPGSRGQKALDPGSRIRIRNTAHRSILSFTSCTGISLRRGALY
jgi:hypothetical protein